MLQGIIDMFKRLFGGDQPAGNPLDNLTVDELRLSRVKLERKRDELLKQIKGLEERKGVLFQEGVESDSRTRVQKAQSIKETEEQVRHLEQQLGFLSKQIQIVSRLRFLKENREQMVDLGIDKMLGQMDTGELRQYVDDISITGAANIDRLNDMIGMLGDALGTNIQQEEDPEIVSLLAQMEAASMPANDITIPSLEAKPAAADKEEPDRNSQLSA